MARPSRNNADYFSHNADFRNDRRIKAVRARFGLAGYGLVLMFIEALTEAEHTQLSTEELEMELLAGDFGVSVTEIDSLLQLAEKIGLFQRNSEGKLICEDLNRALEPVFEKRNRSRQVAQSVKEKQSVTETRITVTETPQSKVKKSKVKESKDSSVADATLDGSNDDDKYSITHKLRLAIEAINPDYYWAAKDGKAAKDLAEKLRNSFVKTQEREPTDEDLVSSLRKLITESRKLQIPFYHFKDVCTLNQQYNALVNEIRNPSRTATGMPKPQPSTIAISTKEALAD